MGVTLPSIDRELAQIDRLLAESEFRLPVGGPVGDRPVYCWAAGRVRGYGCSTEVEDWEATIGLCTPHYLEKTLDSD